jgi:hypothetical protein
MKERGDSELSDERRKSSTFECIIRPLVHPPRGIPPGNILSARRRRYSKGTNGVLFVNFPAYCAIPAAYYYDLPRYCAAAVLTHPAASGTFY